MTVGVTHLDLAQFGNLNH